MAYNHAGYWADIGGSIESFYNFSMGLARDNIPFTLQQPLDTPFFHRYACQHYICKLSEFHRHACQY